MKFRCEKSGINPEIRLAKGLGCLQFNMSYLSIDFFFFSGRNSKQSALIDAFQNMINRYPPSQQAFSMTACYDSLVYGKLHRQVMTSSGKPTFSEFLAVDGQFDDA